MSQEKPGKINIAGISFAVFMLLTMFLFFAPDVLLNPFVDSVDGLFCPDGTEARTAFNSKNYAPGMSTGGFETVCLEDGKVVGTSKYAPIFFYALIGLWIIGYFKLFTYLTRRSRKADAEQAGGTGADVSGAAEQSTLAPETSTKTSADSARLAELKQMHEQGLITASDYEDKKRDILDRL